MLDLNAITTLTLHVIPFVIMMMIAPHIRLTWDPGTLSTG